ncbi:AbrB family transcriptional regulator [Cohnella caldifontis]|uniref:AbrB family transcriptional regulator n=1 Tax=Cohnella caldifontis TaxID=3027471 RepID=UPI0023ED3450|nr:AbrB family transcriptional regulator [Cohnella sp. YIM B05605]
MIRVALALVLALAGGGLFTVIHIPLPWLLGPMTAVFLGARLIKGFQLKWPGSLRNTAMIIIGYSFGLSLTTEALADMGRQLPTMVLMTVLLMVFSALIAFTVAKITGDPLPTVLLGSVPGGLSQMLILAEEAQGVDLTIVTFMQVSRLMMIIFCVPLLIFSPLFGGTHSADAAAAAGSAGADWGGLFPNILPFAAVCVAAAFLAQKIRFPTAFLLGPMIVTAVLHLSGAYGPALPTPLLNAAQLLIGGYVGLLLHPENLEHKVRTIGLAILSGLALIAGSLGFSVLLTELHPISAATSFLSLAPGGMDQMGIMAKEVHGDLAIVSCYQLFRIWFIYFAVTPLIRLIIKRLAPSGHAGGRTAGER